MRDRLVTRPLDQELDPYFFRKPCTLTVEVRSQIQPLNVASSRLVWNELIKRNQYRHPNQLPRSHWSHNIHAVGPNWVDVWNRWLVSETTVEADPVVDFFRANVPWSDDVPVVFVEMRDHAILATWGAFVRAWQHFLYVDEQPFLVSWERSEFLGFGCGGMVNIGYRGLA
jgi:hypothetical protein